MADWLRHHFPAISGSPIWGDETCWVARMMTRRAEHNPPFYWLGRAFDVAHEYGEGTRFGGRLLAVHGPEQCSGHDESDQAAQDVLTEMCAFAWATTHLGATLIEPTAEGASGSEPIQLHVPALAVSLSARRLRPRRTLDDVLAQVEGHATDASRSLPPGGRIVYLDVWHERMFAESLGYRIELAEPLRLAARQASSEQGMGFVLTRPFQWGRPIETWY